MNSKQRRKFKREFKYVITITAGRGMIYYKHDMKILDAIAWCEKHFKKCYRTGIDWDKTDFYFNNSKDAMTFSLRWL